MSRGKKALLLAVWLVLATHLYGYVWSTHLDVFPELPEEAGQWIAKLTGMTNSDNIERLTLYYVLLVSFAVVTAITLAGASLFCLVQKKLQRKPRSKHA